MVTLARHLPRRADVALRGQPRFQSLLVAMFGTAALVLVRIGIYALTLFGVLRGTRELGVRSVLGARPGQLLRLMLSQSLRPVVIGMTAGTVTAVPLASWM